MAGSSSDVSMEVALDSGGSGTPQHFNMSSPRSEDVGNDMHRVQHCEC